MRIDEHETAANSLTLKGYCYSPLTLDWIRSWSRLIPPASTIVLLVVMLPSLLINLPDGQSVMPAIVLTVIFLFLFYAAMCILTLLLRRVLGTTTYSIESGVLVVRVLDVFRVFSARLDCATEVLVGNAQQKDKMHIRVMIGQRKEIVIHALEDMEEFISEIDKYTSVPLLYVDRALSPWTKAQKTIATCVMVLFLSLCVYWLMELAS